MSRNPKALALCLGQTDTAAFRAWFGASKVVDSVGNPGVFFTPDEEFAKEFSDKSGKTVSAYLSIKKPLDLSEGYPNDFYMKHMDTLSKNNLLCMRPEEMWEMLHDGFPSSNEFIAAVKADGYDGLKMVERNGESEVRDVFVAFSPTQIKSATCNLGTFSPDNPDIRCSRGFRQR